MTALSKRWCEVRAASRAGTFSGNVSFTNRGATQDALGWRGAGDRAFTLHYTLTGSGPDGTTTKTGMITRQICGNLGVCPENYKITDEINFRIDNINLTTEEGNGGPSSGIDASSWRPT